MTATISPTTITWRGLTMYGTTGAGEFTFSTLDGWDGLPDARQAVNERPQSHGAFDAPVYSSERRVLASGWRTSMGDRDVQLAEMQAVFNFTPTALSPLVIDHAGRVLTSDARLLRFKPTWAGGFWTWAAEWVCPDPLRYGDPVSIATTFPTLRGGLSYDLYTDGAGTDLGYLDYGAASDTGRIVVTNTGTAAAPVTCQVAGEVDASGFDIAQTGTDLRLRFVGPVSPGSSLVLDGSTGNVLIDGTADRAGQLTYRDWPVIPPGGSLELAFIPLGVNLGAQLTAVVRPGSW